MIAFKYATPCMKIVIGSTLQKNYNHFQLVKELTTSIYKVVGYSNKIEKSNRGVCYINGTKFLIVKNNKHQDIRYHPSWFVDCTQCPFTR
jgi:hypothetical protein